MISLSTLLGGAACGLLYSSIFIAITCLALFDLYKKNDPRIISVFLNHNPSKIVFGFIVLLKPSLGLLGIAFTYFSYISRPEYASGMLGNITLIYFLTIVSIAMLIQAIQSVLFPLGKIYAISNLSLFILIYGMLLPIITR